MIGMAMSVGVCVFAYNEAKSIQRCLESLLTDQLDVPPTIYVVANGCSDNTVSVVRDFAAGRTESIFIEDLSVGDKANAWNHFVFEVSPTHDYYFFCDGDCWFSKGSLPSMIRTLDQAPHANMVSSIPLSGRNRASFAADVINSRGATGNLNLLRADFVSRIRSRGLRMPFGTIGDDSLIGSYAKFDLDFRDGNWDDTRIEVDQESGFFYDSIPIFSFSGLQKYLRRLIRYSTRYHQNMIMRHIFLSGSLMTGTIETLPGTAAELYRMHPEQLKIKWRGYTTLFDVIALLRIRRQV